MTVQCRIKGGANMQPIKNEDIPKSKRDKYPWEKWFCGESVELRRGKRKEFEAKASSMQAMIIRKAAERGYKCRVLLRGDSVIIEVK